MRVAYLEQAQNLRDFLCTRRTGGNWAQAKTMTECVLTERINITPATISTVRIGPCSRRSHQLGRPLLALS